MVKTEDVPTPLIVNYSFGNVAFEEVPDYEGESVLVFIGENIGDDMTKLTEKFEFLKLIEHTHDHEHHEHHHHHHEHGHEHHSHA